MAKIKSSKYTLEPHTDFSGGLNVDSAVDNLEENQLEILENFDLNQKGALDQRKGCIALNTAPYAAEVKQLFEWPRSNGDIMVLAMIGTSLYLINESNNWTATLIKALDDSNIGYFIHQDKFYLTGKEGGVDKYWVYTDNKQIETITVIGSVTTTGNVDIIVTSAILSGSPLKVHCSVTSGDTASAVATKIISALRANSNIGAVFSVSGENADVVLTTIEGGAHDATLNIEIKQQGVKQVEAQWLWATDLITTAGNAYVTVTASGLTGSPITIQVPVALNDGPTEVGQKIRTALSANTNISNFFTVDNSVGGITLTKKVAEANDSTLNIAYGNSTCAGLHGDDSSSTIVNGKISAAGLTDVPTSVDTQDGGELVVTEVSPNSDSTNDLSPIKRCRRFLWNYRNMRIYASGDPKDRDCLYYSEANDPTFFKKTNKVYPTTGDGDVAELSLLSTALLTIYDNSIWAWTGTDPATDATWEKLPLTHGTTAPGSVCITPSSLTMVSEGGLHALNPAILDKEIMLLSNEEMSVNMAENKIMKILQSIVHPETVRSVYDTINRRYYLAYGDDADDPNNNKILVLYWPLKSFSIYNGIIANDMIRRRSGTILVASGNYILQMNTGLNDVDILTGQPKAIDAQVRSKQWGLGSNMNLKRTNKLFLAVVQYSEGDSTIDLGVISGYKSLLWKNVLLNEAFIWGTEWGRIWGWSDVVGKEARCGIKGQRFQFYCRHNKLNEPLTILGVGFNFKYSKPKGVKIRVKAQKNILS
jgi:hypothetical protein